MSVRCWSIGLGVCQSVTRLRCANTAVRIEVRLGWRLMETNEQCLWRKSRFSSRIGCGFRQITWPFVGHGVINMCRATVKNVGHLLATKAHRVKVLFYGPWLQLFSDTKTETKTHIVHTILVPGTIKRQFCRAAVATCQFARILMSGSEDCQFFTTHSTW